LRLRGRPEIWREDPLRLVGRIFLRLHSWWIRKTYPFASIGNDVEIHYPCDMRRYLSHRIKLGSSIIIYKDVQFGVSCEDREEKGDPVIIIEDGCIIVRRCQISARNCVHFERNVILSASSLIMDHGHAYDDTAKSIKEQGLTPGGRIRIGEGSWIGHGAAIVCASGELTLGRNCVVAANALVTRSFGPYSVIAGNPARLVKQFDPAKKEWVLGSSGFAGQR
jgi:acetyltransferase-like isoleucine patch superfamily enzyme